MNRMEQMIWTSAFAAEWARERKFRADHPISDLDFENISGFSCAEIADVALKHFREALTGDDRKYLTPVDEGWIVS